jgi:hypothetical protein
MRETRLNIRLATILQKTQKNDLTPDFYVYKAYNTLLIMPSQRKLISTIAHNTQITAHDARATAHDARATAHDARATAHDARATAHNTRATAHDTQTTINQSIKLLNKQNVKSLKLKIYGINNNPQKRCGFQ